MLVCDTSALIAYLDRTERMHADVAAALEADPGPFVVSPFVLAELDYLLLTRRGVDSERAALAELAGGAWDLPSFGPDDVREASDLIGRYRDQGIGLADASLVVLAKRFGTRTLLTLDHRHFDVLRPLDGGRFRLLP